MSVRLRMSRFEEADFLKNIEKFSYICIPSHLKRHSSLELDHTSAIWEYIGQRSIGNVVSERRLR